MSDLAITFHFLSSGALTVLKLLFLTGGIALFIGLFVGVLQYFRIPIIKQLLTIYIIAMRGIPILVLLSLTFFSLNIGSSLLAAIIALSLYNGAYMAEIFRGGIEAIPEGQFEAADTLSLTTTQKMWTIILPQVWNAVLPPLTGQYVLLVKTTAVVSVIGVMGLVSSARSTITQIGHSPLIYLIVALLYVIMCVFLEQLSSYLED